MEGVTTEYIQALNDRITALENENLLLRKYQLNSEVQNIHSTDRWPIEINLNEMLYQDLFLFALDGIIFWDEKGSIIKANDAACRIFECTYEKLLTSTLNDFIYEKNGKFFEIIDRLNKTGEIREELPFLMPNGQIKLLEFTAKLNSINGYHISIFRNISQRHHMENELRESEEKLRRIFEGALEGLLLWDDECRVVDINRVGQTIFGVTKEEIIGNHLFDVIIENEEDKEQLKKKFRDFVLNDGEQETIPLTLKGGVKKHFEIATKRQIAVGTHLMVFRDITEKLELQEQLRKSDTLNVIGELAAGIAHEIRNPMTALKGFIQLLQGEIKGHKMYFQVIMSELKRIDSIINEFLILAKPQAVQYQQKDIRTILRETVDLLSAQAVLHDVQFRTNYHSNSRIICEPNQLKKVFINIIKNAIEVMHNGGFITINVIETNDHYVHISIKDEGTGMDEEKMKRLGEPFYTTKDRGTGLGLMVSYKIIEEHDGYIEVESNLGVGTTFHIYLPLNEGKELIK